MTHQPVQRSLDSFPAPENGTRLLYALNAASAALQRSAHSEADVYQAVKAQIAAIGLRGGVSLLDDDGSKLCVQTVVLPSKVSHKLEKLIEQRLEGYHFPVEQVDVYCQVVRTEAPLYVQDSSQVISQLIPPNLRRFSAGITKLLGKFPAIYAPIIFEGQVRGVLNMVGNSLTPEDAPAMEAFANHIGIALDNARLFAAMQAEILERKQAEETSRQMELDLHQQAAQLAVLHALSLDITTLVDFASLLEKIVERATQLLGAKGGALYICEDEREEVRLRVEHYLGGKQLIGITFKYGEGAAGRVAQTGEPLIIHDYVSWQGRSKHVDTQPLYNAVLSVPMIWQGKVVGVLQVLDGKNRHFNLADQQLLILFANQAAIAFENAHLFEKAATDHRHLQLLFDISQELASSLDVDAMLERALSLTCMALSGSMGQAFLFDENEGQLKLRALYHEGAAVKMEQSLDINLRPGEGLAGWVGQKQQAVSVPDVSKDARWLHLAAIDTGVCSAVSAPILAGNQLLGVISVLHSRVAAFSEDQGALLQAICHEIGLALSNAQRYQQVNRRLKEITLIQSLAEIFNQRLDLQSLLDEIVVQLANRLHYPRVEIYLVDGELLELRAQYGGQTNWKQIPFGEGAIGQEAVTGEAVMIQNNAGSEDGRQPVAFLSVPILQGRIVVGVIHIETDVAGQLAAQDQYLMQVLAGQISIALENAVLYERVRSHAEELEQTVSRRTAELAELYELSQRIGYTLSYDELMRLMIAHLNKAMDGVVVAGGFYYEGNLAEYVEICKPVSPSAMSTLWAYWQHVLHRFGKTGHNRDEAAIEIGKGACYQADTPPVSQLEHLIHTPIRIGEELVGVLIAGFEASAGIGDEQTRLLNTFAHQAAAAVQRLGVMLAEERRRLESLVEHLPVGVLLLDDNNNLLLVNTLAKAYLSVLNVGGPSDRLTMLGTQPVADLMIHYPEPMPVEVISNGPPTRVFEAQIRPVEAEQRQWVLTLREVTHEREYRAQIQMQDRLATVGQLAAGIAHDFNNIMAAILVYADLLRSDPKLTPVARNQLGIIQEQVQRASSLIRQILDFSRRSVMEQSSLDLLPFVKEMEKMLRRVIPETINLRLSYQPAGYVVKADPSRLQQALMNLAVNARDAMPEGGILLFELDKLVLTDGDAPPSSEMKPGYWIRITVSDTGTGIPSENIAHIFEPFFTTKPVGQGTGLGLAQVYGIIKQHEGFIEVHSQEGKGTRFDIYLPGEVAAVNTLPVQERPVKLNGAGKRALVVEDDPATLAAIQTLLEASEYQVLTATNGKEALKRYDRDMNSVELVVSDLVMPQMGGVALYNQISSRWPKAKMLFVTGHPMEGESRNLLERGQVSWLQKPFSIQQFNRAVRTLVETDMTGQD